MKLREFLESEGGKLFVLISLLVWIAVLAMILHMTGHDPQETGRTLMSNAFTSLFTAIMLKLTEKKAAG